MKGQHEVLRVRHSSLLRQLSCRDLKMSIYKLDPFFMLKILAPQSEDLYAWPPVALLGAGRFRFPPDLTLGYGSFLSNSP